MSSTKVWSEFSLSSGIALISPCLSWDNFSLILKFLKLFFQGKSGVSL